MEPSVAIVVYIIVRIVVWILVTIVVWIIVRIVVWIIVTRVVWIIMKMFQPLTQSECEHLYNMHRDDKTSDENRAMISPRQGGALSTCPSLAHTTL